MQSGEGMYAFVSHAFAEGAVGLIQVGAPQRGVGEGH